MHHVLITYCTLKSIYFADRYLLCQEGLIPTTTRALDSWWGGGRFSMSDVNSDKYPSQSFKLE